MIDPIWLANRIVENSSIWQNDFQDPLRFSQFIRERKVQFWERYIFHLWDLGWVRAEFVQANNSISVKDIVPLETSPEDGYYYADNRQLSTTKPLSEVPIRQYCEEKPVIVPYFHPFKYYVFWHIQRYMQLAISQYQIMNPSKYPALLENQIQVFLAWTQSESAVEEVNRWDKLARLAIATEPVFYPEVMGTFTWAYPSTLEEHLDKCQSLKTCLIEEYLKIGLQPIKDMLEDLCTSAAMIEPNTTVHSLMRFVRGKTRRQITGNLGGAILLKTMAEIIRRMTEETFEEPLPEEDEIGIGFWIDGAKEQFYGTKRIFDEKSMAKRYLLRSMGLDAEVRTHVYVEGATEYGAFSFLLQGVNQVDIFDLKGDFLQAKGKGLSFRNNLEQDKKNQVFSFIILDGDVSDNLRVVRKAVEDGIFCGNFFVSERDFEFQNFTIDELVKIAWGLLDDFQKSRVNYQAITDAVKIATTGKEFFKFIKTVGTEFTHFEKGNEWGQALAKYAHAFPTIEGGDRVRPLITSVQTIIRSVDKDYRSTREKSRVDPETGKLIPR